MQFVMNLCVRLILLPFILLCLLAIMALVTVAVLVSAVIAALAFPKKVEQTIMDELAKRRK